MKISKRGLEIFQKIHEIYETFKLENFIPHLYVYVHIEWFFVVQCCYSLSSELGFLPYRGHSCELGLIFNIVQYVLWTLMFWTSWCFRYQIDKCSSSWLSHTGWLMCAIWKKTQTSMHKHNLSVSVLFHMRQ